MRPASTVRTRRGPRRVSAGRGPVLRVKSVSAPGGIRNPNLLIRSGSIDPNTAARGRLATTGHLAFSQVISVAAGAHRRHESERYATETPRTSGAHSGTQNGHRDRPTNPGSRNHTSAPLAQPRVALPSRRSESPCPHSRPMEPRPSLQHGSWSRSSASWFRSELSMPGSTRINASSPRSAMALLHTHSLCRTQTPSASSSSDVPTPPASPPGVSYDARLRRDPGPAGVPPENRLSCRGLVRVGSCSAAARLPSELGAQDRRRAGHGTHLPLRTRAREVLHPAVGGDGDPVR